MSNYKGYNLNDPGDPAPWGQKEQNVFKQLIDRIEDFIPTAVTNFLGLNDTPSDYTGQANKNVIVNGTETGLSFSDSTFLNNTDTPVSYGGQAGKAPVVNATENGLEFETVFKGESFTELADTPSDYTGAAGKRVTVTEAEDGLEFVEDPFKPLVGVDENKNYVTKVDENTISIASGTGTNRKSDLSEYKVSWSAMPSVDVSFLLDGQLRWVVFQNNAGQTGVELTFLTVAPATLDTAEQYQWVGRIWRENGVLQVGDRHIMLSVDPQVSRTNAWQSPAGNVSVTVSNATDVGLLSISSGEVTRWPVVELETFHHVWKYNGMPSVVSMWDHVQGSSGFTIVSDNAVGDTTDIRTIADYWDNNGSLDLVPTNDFVAHLIGVYAGSEERVLFRGQKTYDTLADAELGISIDPLNESPWVSDLRQVSKLAWMIVKRGTRDFSNSANCVFVPYSLLGSGGGSGTTPNLEQVLASGGEVDMSESLETDRIMSFIRDGIRQLSLFGNGSLQGQSGIFADMAMGDSRTAGTHAVDTMLECGESGDLGGVVNSVDVVESAADFEFTSSNSGFAGNGGYIDSELTHNGKPYYVNGIYYLAYGVVTAVGGLWFVVTTLESGDLMFSNALYRQNAISETPDGVDEYTGQNAEANNGAEVTAPTGIARPSIVGETITAKKVQQSGSIGAPALDLSTTSAQIGSGDWNWRATATLLQGVLNGVPRFQSDGSVTLVYSPDGNVSIAVTNSGVSVSTGASGTFTSNDGKTITVSNGIITSIV